MAGGRASLPGRWRRCGAARVLAATGDDPRSWALLFLAGPPAYFALEWIGSRLFGSEVGARIAPTRFSWARIAYGVLVLLVLLAPFVSWGLSRAR